MAIATSAALLGMKTTETRLQSFITMDVAASQAVNDLYSQGLQMEQALRNIILDPSNRKAIDNLEQAKKELAEQEAIRNGDERNFQKVLDRVQPYKDRVAQHERNIQQIQRELSNLR